MNITINRLRSNYLYTEGELRINGLRNTFSVEASEIMLPVGTYSVRIVKRSARKQSLNIFLDGVDTGWNIGLDHSWIGSKKNRIICIGTPLIPGATYKGSKDFERINDRISKCVARNEPIELTITETYCVSNNPIRYWLEPADHGCPPSKRRVEVDDDGIAYIYDGDTLVKTVFPKDNLSNSSNHSNS